MGEISAVAAARAAVIRNDQQALRDRQQQERERLDAIRQRELDRARLDARELQARRQARFENIRDDVRAQIEQDRFLDAQFQARLTRDRDIENARLQREILDEQLLAQDRDVQFDRPTLNPSEVVGSVRTPEEIAIARALADPGRPEPAPAAPNPADAGPRPEPPAPIEAGPRVEPLAPLAPPEPFEPLETPARVDPATFDALERDRLDRIAERRDEERDFRVRQDIDLRLARDRIDQGAFDPGVPRGSVVDVFG